MGLGIGHAGACFRQVEVQVIEVGQIIVFTVDQGVHAVADSPVDHGGQPGVVMAAVDALGSVGQLDGQVLVLFPGHVVGGIGDARIVEQGLVVEQHPEVGAEGQAGLDAVKGVAALHAHEAGQIIAVALDVGVQGLGVAGLVPVQDVGDLFDHEDVGGVVAGQHGAGLGAVILGSHVHILDGDAGVGGFESFLLGGVIGGGVDVPRHDLQDDAVVGGGADHGQDHDHGQRESQQFLHG